MHPKGSPWTSTCGSRPANGAGVESGLSGIVVAELKQERADRTSPFVRIMRAMGYRQAGMSKYCIGMLQHARRPEIQRLQAGASAASSGFAAPPDPLTEAP